MKKNLIIIRAGDNSLHTEWFGQNQNFDIIVSYYGNNDYIYKDQSQRFDCKGSKWEAMHIQLNDSAINWRQYDYIWLPDDDLRTTCENINRFFDITAEANACLSQPALDDNSYYWWDITKQDKKFRYRKTNFVEIMAPCFRKDFLEKCLPYLGETKSGHYFEFLWSKLINHNEDNFIIVDESPITHTRPIGSAGSGLSGAQIDKKKEIRHLIKKYNLVAETKNFYGVDFNNKKSYP